MSENQLKNGAISKLDQVLAALDNGDSGEARRFLRVASEFLDDRGIRGIVTFVSRVVEGSVDVEQFLREEFDD